MLTEGTERTVAATKSANLRAFHDKEFSDIIVRCEGVDFKCHKLILAGRSLVFADYLRLDDEVRATGVIEIEEETAATVYGLIQLLYTDKMDERTNYDNTDIVPYNPLAHMARVYGLAHKYEIADAKIVVREIMENALTKGRWSFESASNCGTGEIRNEVPEIFCDTVKTVWSTTPENDRGLRDLILDYSHLMGKDILDVSHHKVRQMLIEIPEFAVDVTKALWIGGASIRNYKCPECKRIVQLCEFSTRDECTLCYLCGLPNRCLWEPLAIAHADFIPDFTAPENKKRKAGQH